MSRYQVCVSLLALAGLSAISSASSLRRPSGGLGAPSPAPLIDFAGARDDGRTFPPDPSGAAGIDHLVVVANDELRVQSKDGLELSRVRLSVFFRSLSVTDVFAPRVVFDPHESRWYVCAAAERQAAGASLLLAVSAGRDPTGTWHFSRYDADSADLDWIDAPALGFNARWIAVTAGIFRLNLFRESRILLFDKATLLQGDETTPTVVPIPGEIRLLPASTLDPDVETMYFAGSSSSTIRIFHVSPGETAELIEGSPAVVPPESSWASEYPKPPTEVGFAPQAGHPAKIDCGDDRLGSLVLRGGSLWTAHTIFQLPAPPDPSRSDVQWWQIATDGTVLQRGILDDPAGEWFYAFPSVAVNGVGDVLVGFSRFSLTSFGEAAYAFHAAADPAGTLREVVSLKQGEDWYLVVDSAELKNRWGSRSATVVDAADDRTLWTIQEFAATQFLDRSRWGTWWGAVDPSPVDQDGDGVTDLLDVCRAVPDPLQLDGDFDRIGTACDNCRASSNNDQLDFDADGVGDACEAGGELADVDNSGRVDGFDLALFSRSFGSIRGGARYDARADLNRDGEVEGEDLSLLGASWGQVTGGAR